MRVILVLVSPLAVLILLNYGYLERLSLIGYDLLYDMRGSIQASDRIILVKQDEASTDFYNTRLSDWPRSHHARLVDKLADAGADLVVFDYDFSRPTTAEDDGAFARAITEAGNIILANRLLASGEILQPLDAFTENSLGEGFIDTNLDRDGAWRRMIYMNLTRDGYINFSLPMVTAEIYEDFPEDQRDLDNPDALGWGTHRLPYPDMLINFTGADGNFSSLSYFQVLENQYNADQVSGKIVLVGNTHRLGKDIFSVPTDKQMSGLEVHANAIASILDDQFITPLPKWALVSLVMLSGFIGGVIIFLRRPRLRSNLVLMITFTMLIVLASYLLFTYMLSWLDMVPLLLAFIASISISTSYHWKQSREREKEIRGLFGHYVSKNVVDAILSENIPVKLDGHRTQVTILFSDIRGFTTISESLPPPELGRLLNLYFDEMIAAVFQNNGTLDKLMGDAVMAFFGSPMEDIDHQQQACQCASDMIDRLHALNSSGKLPKGIRLEIGIGLHTGDAIVGNLGSSDFADYTVIGDSVNLASRLEGLNKQYATNIIISADTWKHVKNTYKCRELDIVKVKGKEEEKPIYEMIVNDTSTAVIDHYQQALAYYRQREWKAALAITNKLIEQYADGPSRQLAEKCRQLVNNPPASGWKPVTRLDEK